MTGRCGGNCLRRLGTRAEPSLHSSTDPDTPLSSASLSAASSSSGKSSAIWPTASSTPECGRRSLLGANSSRRSRRFSRSSCWIRRSRASISRWCASASEATSALNPSTSSGSERESIAGWTGLDTLLAIEVRAEFGSSHIDSLEQHRELRAVELDPWHLEIDLLEAAELQALGQHPESVAIPDQDPHAIAPAVEEAEQVTRERVLAELLAYDAHQAIDTTASVDR